MIDLLHPDKNQLLQKWGHVVAVTSHIRTFDTALELAWLAEYATHCSSILEIGSYDGRSAKVMLVANPELSLVSLDTWDDENLPDYKHNLGPEIEAGRVLFWQGESQKFFEAMRENRDIGFSTEAHDGCFIDGGHLEHLVAADIRGVMPLMKPGSLMAGHDHRGDNDVARGVRSVLPDAKAVCESIWAYQL